MKNVRRIVNLRGTSGSGKSTVARQFMTGAVPIMRNGKIVAYRGELATIVDRYESPCGEASGPLDRIVRLAAEFADQGENVIFEGLMSCHDPTRIIWLSGHHQVIVGVMETPIAQCLVNVKARREASGNQRPWDPEITIKRHRAIANLAERLRAKGIDVRPVPYPNGAEVVRGWLEYKQLEKEKEQYEICNM